MSAKLCIQAAAAAAEALDLCASCFLFVFTLNCQRSREEKGREGMRRPLTGVLLFKRVEREMSTERERGKEELIISAAAANKSLITSHLPSAVANTLVCVCASIRVVVVVVVPARAWQWPSRMKMKMRKKPNEKGHSRRVVTTTARIGPITWQCQAKAATAAEE